MSDLQQLPNESQVHVDGLGLNDRMRIYADERDPNAGSTSHEYTVFMSEGPWPADDDLPVFTPARISFQRGACDLTGSTPGILDSVLVAILLDRYRGFQSGPFACRENAQVITKLEEALHWMRERAWYRHRQNVLGTNDPHKQPK